MPPESPTRSERATVAIAFTENEIAQLRGTLVETAGAVAADLTGLRVTFQLYDGPDHLRTVATSLGRDSRTAAAVFANGAGVAGWVAQQRTTAFIEDVSVDPHFLPIDGSPNQGAFLCLPLVSEYACYGTLSVRAQTEDALARPIRGLLRYVARSAAHDIARYRQHAMLRAVRDMASSDGGGDRIARVGELSCALVQDPVMLLVTGDATGASARIFARDASEADGLRSLRDWALQRFEAMQGHAARHMPSIHAVHGYIVHAVPLLMGDSPIGLLCYCHTRERTESLDQALGAHAIETQVQLALVHRQWEAERRRCRTILAQIREGILVLDGAGSVVLEANPAFYHLVGIPEGVLSAPRALRELQQWWSVRELGTAANEPDRPRRREIYPVAIPGRTLAVTEYPAVDGEGSYRLWVLHDASEISRIEQVRAEFMSVVSHEVRSPLASLYGYLSILATEKAGPLTEMQRESLRIMHLSVRQLRRLADDINDLLQSDSGETVLKRETVDPVEVVRAAATSMLPLLQTNDVRCDLEIDAPLPPLLLDPVRFHQVLTNLMNNAIKYSEPGASIAVRAYVAGDALHISVHDSGPGIAPEDRERIFDRFERGQSPIRHDGSGLGLGLAVVRELTEMHGGRVWVESTPGNGSTFIVSIPLSPQN